MHSATLRKYFSTPSLGLFIFLWLSLSATGDTLSIYKFLTFAIQYDFLNPWNAALIGEATWAQGDPGPFVYPIGMYLLLLPLRAISFFLGATNTEYSPLGASPLNMGLTFAILILSKFCLRLGELLQYKVGKSKIGLLVVFSPTIAVSFYFGRQLDILPTLFSLISLVWLFERKYVASSIILGIAITLKVYPLLLVIPFVFYILRNSHDKKYSIRHVLLFLMFSMGIPCLLTLIFYSPEYLDAVIKNPSLGRLFWFKFMLGGSWSPVLVFPVVYSLLLLIMFQNMRNCVMDKRKFTALVGIVLLLPCILASPMVMWWTWSAPFIIVYAVSQKNSSKFKKSDLDIMKTYLLLGTLNLCYAFYDKWSYLSQLATWYRYPWPLPESPQGLMERFVGVDYAELVRQVIFSTQWGVGFTIAVLILIQVLTSERESQ